MLAKEHAARDTFSTVELLFNISKLDPAGKPSWLKWHRSVRIEKTAEARERKQEKNHDLTTTTHILYPRRNGTSCSCGLSQRKCLHADARCLGSYLSG